MNAYHQFVQAANVRDGNALICLIQEHPELHSYEGENGFLLDIIESRCPEFFEMAFQAGLHPDSSPASLLQVAATQSDLALVRLCLQYGADIERRNSEGETALGYAVSWGSLEVVKLLVESGAEVNAIEGCAGQYLSTALDSACSDDPKYNRPEIRAYLCERGAKRYSELTPDVSESHCT